MSGVGAYTNKIIGAFVTVLVGLTILPLINTEITEAVGSGGALENVAGSGLLSIISLLLIVSLVFVVIPKKNA